MELEFERKGRGGRWLWRAVPRRLLPELLSGDVSLRVLLHNFAARHLEILLGDVDAAFTQGKHASLRAHTLGGTASKQRKSKKKPAKHANQTRKHDR